MKHNSKLNNSHPKIAYLLPNLMISGGVGVVLKHVYELRQRKNNAVVFCYDMTYNGAWFYLINEVPVYPFSEYYNICGKNGAKHLVATWWETAFEVAKTNAKYKHYFLQSLEDRFYPDEHPFSKAFYLSLFLGLDVFTEANWINDWLKDNLGIKTIVVPNGIDLDVFYPASNLPKNRAKLRVLIEGPPSLPFKGVGDCFEAITDLDVEIWYIMGRDGKPAPNWKIDRLFSNVPFVEMRDIYSQCDVLLKMSKVEGVFGPPLEMMACGGTCVVGDVTGHDEYCMHEKNCLIVNKNSASDARSAIVRLMNDDALLQRLKSEGINTAQKFNWNNSIDVLEQLFLSKQHRKEMTIGQGIIENIAELYKYINNSITLEIQIEVLNQQVNEYKHQLKLVHQSKTWRYREKMIVFIEEFVKGNIKTKINYFKTLLKKHNQ